MRGWHAFAALVLLVAAPPAEAAAARVSGALTLHEPAEVAGALDLASRVAGVDLAPAAHPGTSFALEWEAARGTLHGHQWVTAGASHTSVPPREREPLSFGAGRLVRIDCAPGCQVLLYSEGDGALALRADHDGPLAQAREEVVYWAELDTGADGTFLHAFPPGTLLLGAGTQPAEADGRATAVGDHRLFARDALLHIQTAEGVRVVDARDEREDVDGPFGPAAARTRSRFVLFHLDGASLDAPLSDVLVLAPASDATLEGRFAADDASGRVVVDGAARTLDHGSLHVEGTFDLALGVDGAADGSALLGATAPRQAARLEGHAREAWIDGRLVTRSAGAAEATAASLAAILVALLLLAPRLALPLYSRISRDRVLANPNRRLLMERLSEAPGQSVTDLGRAAGIARVVVRHHMAILAAHGLVATRVQGRRRLFFPAGHAPDRDALAVRGVLSDASRLRVAEAVARSEAPAHATQLSIARATGLSPRVVSYHLARLEQLGLVEAEGAWRRTYRATPRLSESVVRASETTRTETT